MARNVQLNPFGSWLEGYRLADQDNKKDLTTNAALEGAWLGNDAARLANLFNYDTYGEQRQRYGNASKLDAQRSVINDEGFKADWATAKLKAESMGLTLQEFLDKYPEYKDSLYKSKKSVRDVSDINSNYAPGIANQQNKNTMHGLTNYIHRDETIWNQGQDTYNRNNEMTELQMVMALAASIEANPSLRAALPPKYQAMFPEPNIVNAEGLSTNNTNGDYMYDAVNPTLAPTPQDPWAQYGDTSRFSGNPFAGLTGDTGQTSQVAQTGQAAQTSQTTLPTYASLNTTIGSYGAGNPFGQIVAANTPNAVTKEDEIAAWQESQRAKGLSRGY